MSRHILILGGTTEARQLAECLAGRHDVAATLSLAGRTTAPLAQPVPVRSGGFGGIDGLARHLREHQIRVLIDATHPYAQKISAHAVAAAALTDTPMLALRRPPWRPIPGDRWVEVQSAEDAVSHLGTEPQNVFLALGRQEIAPFSRAPQHRYLIRSVEPIDPPLAVPYARYLRGRGPFSEHDDRALLLAHAVNIVVAKNSGGTATYGKIAAARSLGIPVLLLRRPHGPPAQCAATVGEAIAWLDHALAAARDRGV
ncbi:MAG: cobalt-precorrin-6A reductase [Steroidobacteraceae bacterium]|nr:cobalt-precorrin-6A reductase [Steroidobacteraceae bacterium]